MNNAKNTLELPAITKDFLRKEGIAVDNLFAEIWKSLKIPSLLTQLGFTKRSGPSVSEVVYLLLMWVWVKNESIYLFSRTAMQTFTKSKKDIIYDYIKKEDVNWRGLNLQSAKKVYQSENLKCCEHKAFVLDDSVKIRCGKKMAGISSHFDHLTGRTVRGEQVLTLGHTTEKSFLPLDSDIFISAKPLATSINKFQDKRSIAAKRYTEGVNLTKPQMAEKMIKRAIRSSINADYLLADAWFGSKAMISMALENNIIPLLRMKKGNMKYNILVNTQEQQLNAKEIYQTCVRKQWNKLNASKIRVKIVDVKLNLATSDKDPIQMQDVRLLFVKNFKEDEQESKESTSWALFLSTDMSLSAIKMLEIYSLRWGIEVYFKESKQYLGFLKEQTKSFASHIASIHLCAIRFCILVYGKHNHEDELRNCDIRSEISNSLTQLSYAKQLWILFKALLSNTLDEFSTSLGNSYIEKISQRMEDKVNAFFIQALQLDLFTLQLECSSQE